MDVLKDFKERAASELKTIVFAESDDERIVKAAAEIESEVIAQIVIRNSKIH
jgi:phosphate acetyltransferase